MDMTEKMSTATLYSCNGLVILDDVGSAVLPPTCSLNLQIQFP